jgi:hypothetical protein
MEVPKLLLILVEVDHQLLQKEHLSWWKEVGFMRGIIQIHIEKDRWTECS